jgi:hypothetical protein
MSYQLYVTGGYGFTESILPSLLHPSNAVDIAQDYFTRGYQGQHIDLPPDADVPQTGTLTDSQKQTLLDDLQEGRLVLASRYEPGFALFTEPKASRDLLRNDLPAALRQRLEHQWPGAGRSGGSGGRSRSDSLAPANEPVHYSPEPPMPERPIPGAGSFQLTLAYRWSGGTGLANLPFEVGTGQDLVKGTLDHKGEARLEGLNGRFATARLNTDASDDEVRHQRHRIQYALNEILKQERKEADALAQEYQHLPWYQRGLIITGAAFQGVTDAGIGLLQFAGSVAELASPSQLMMDALNAAWSASENTSDANWYDTFQSAYDDTRHQRWVKALGFSPSDITREDIAEAYELANLVMDDPALKQSLNDFAIEYASIQHRTEVSYLIGSVVFDLILAALLAIATGGAGAAGAAASNIRHARILTHLGETVQAYGKAVRAQRLRHLWRDIDLSKQSRLEAIAPKRVKGLKLKAARLDSTQRAEHILRKTLPTKAQLAKVKAIPKGQRPDPATYLSPDYRAAHADLFRNGVVRIQPSAPSGKIGRTETWVLPKFVADNAIFQSQGDVRMLEKLLGFDNGYLGNEPIRIDIPSPSGYRIPTGNEFGANKFWQPGGNTWPGGLPEAIIDPVPSGKYTVKPAF